MSSCCCRPLLDGLGTFTSVGSNWRIFFRLLAISLCLFLSFFLEGRYLEGYLSFQRTFVPFLTKTPLINVCSFDMKTSVEKSFMENITLPVSYSS